MGYSFFAKTFHYSSERLQLPRGNAYFSRARDKKSREINDFAAFFTKRQGLGA